LCRDDADAGVSGDFPPAVAGESHAPTKGWTIVDLKRGCRNLFANDPDQIADQILWHGSDQSG
jgi:hypothetical protein